MAHNVGNLLDEVKVRRSIFADTHHSVSLVHYFLQLKVYSPLENVFYILYSIFNALPRLSYRP